MVGLYVIRLLIRSRQSGEALFWKTFCHVWSGIFGKLNSAKLWFMLFISSFVGVPLILMIST